MIYMTFKIKKDWLFKVLLAVSGIFNLVALVLMVNAFGSGSGEVLAFSLSVFLVLLLINGYAIYNIFKSYKIGLTKDSIKVSDFSRVEIPYSTIRSIKKEREPSKYGLYDALLVIKYNKFDTIKLNVEDLENVFDNLKEMVQKANLDKVVNSVVTKQDGSREIQQNIPTSAGATNMGGATLIMPATATPTGNVIVQPNTTTATVVRPTTNQQTAGAMVRPNTGVQQPIARPVTAHQTAGAMVRPISNTNQQVVRTTQQPTAGAMVRPATANPNQQVVRTTTNAMVRPVQTAPQPVARTVTTTTTTTKPAGQVSTPGSTQSTIVNPDGSKRIITTTTTVKPTE
ncbi:MAG: hypothetical protein R3Y60_03730 [bacterium]